MQSLGFLAGGSISMADDVSADGSVVVGQADGSAPGSFDRQAFRWTSGGGMVGLGFLPGDSSSQARGVSGDGAVVVGSSGDAGSEAFRWTSGAGMVGLGIAPGGTFSSAHATSADGSVVVGAADGLDGGAFRWTSATGIVDLGLLPGGEFSIAWGVSADGSVVVGVADSAAFPDGEAFVWDSVYGMRSVWQLLIDGGVDLTGWTLGPFGEVSGVSGDGLTIVGVGQNPLGQTEGWVATIPEPGAPLLMLAALLALVGWRRA
jgi:probable HAF family extracellular repeat protein